MATLHQHMGKRARKINGLIGLEIETETKNNYLVPDSLADYWSCHEDGSLRHYGKEFVFRHPLDYKSEDYNKALELFDEFAKSIDFEKSVYSSVHVHFNMQNMEIVHMFNFIGLYFLFEEVLGHYCGPDRNGNLFCLKTSSAEYVVDIVKDMAKAFENRNGYDSFIYFLNQNNLKYGGLNISSLRTHGSLEVRTHGGTVDINEIDRWVGILYQIYESAQSFKDPVHILKTFQAATPEWFLDRVFRDFSSHLDKSVFTKTLRNPLWYLSSLAACVKWDKVGNVIEPTTEKKLKSKIKYNYLVLPADVMQITTDDHLHANHINDTIAEYANHGIGATLIAEDL